jgi:branched-chain amino acid transport system permease protein
MTTFLQLTFAGISLGSVYALISLGWTALFQVAKIYNLAQGAFVVVAAMTYAYFAHDLGWPFPLAIGASLLVGLALGMVLYKVILNSRTARGEIGQIVMSIGAALVVSEALKYIWGPDPRGADAYLPTRPFNFFGAAVLPHTLLLWGGTAIMFMASWAIFHWTLLGKALRACSESDVAARLAGINPQRMHILAFSIAAISGSLGGILLVPLVAVSSNDVIPFGIFGLIGAIVGRWRHVPAAVGSIVLGLVGSYTGGYVSSVWQDAVLYAALIISLLAMRKRQPGHRRLWWLRQRMFRSADESERIPVIDQV